MRISDWSSDVCSSDLPNDGNISGIGFEGDKLIIPDAYRCSSIGIGNPEETIVGRGNRLASTSKGWSKAYVTKYLADNGISAKWFNCVGLAKLLDDGSYATLGTRSEEHTSELQSLMRISYAVFCLKKKNKIEVYNTT